MGSAMARESRPPGRRRPSRPAADGQRPSGRIYLPTVAIAILAAWLSWRG